MVQQGAFRVADSNSLTRFASRFLRRDPKPSIDLNIGRLGHENSRKAENTNVKLKRAQTLNPNKHLQAL